ncbi:hypothetical protein ACSV9I_07315 [Rhizobium sp. G187]|uniref:hypothetical protein n=1 Tax=unclassified Rhizobium TaxID=2613769 RepID=UPI0006B98B31|nr:hypothetical protein [Rhizobium sp. AAP43]KPF46881.1 hypothetical protein IP76_03155 [Rhizobium sp. AAP43]
MKKLIASLGGLFLLAGCQTDVAQSVADSQVPPSASVRNQLVRIINNNGGKIGDFVRPEISSVVLLQPETKTYAFCVRAWHAQRQRQPDVIGFSVRNGQILGSTANDYRCRDQRLRYYPYPELIAVRGTN